MIRLSMIALAAATLGLAACQPQKTPEQIQAEQAAAALGALGAGKIPGEMTPEQMAALAKIGAAAAANDASATPEERAKMQAISNALARGQVHPAAAAYIAGADKVFALLDDVKDVAGVNAATPQVTAIYAEMAGPAATLKAMPEDQRDVAFGSAVAQLMGMSTKAAGLLSRTSYDPDTMQAIGALLDKMPQMD